MKEKLDKLLEVQTEIRVDVAGIKKDVGRNTKDLSEHIRRTEVAEERISVLERLAIQNSAVWKVVLGLSVVATLAVAAYQLYGVL